jgi:hypothetical protein
VLRRTAAEEILGEWGVRDVTPPSQVERERLAHDLELNPGAGRPLRRRLRNFRPEADTYIASLGGPLPYMRRLRRIEEETAAHLERLRAAHALYGRDPAAWRRVAERWDFGAVNELIDQHNRWYPIEARLPMDPRSRDFVRVGGRPYRRAPLDAAWILDRFPPAGGASH